MLRGGVSLWQGAINGGLPSTHEKGGEFYNFKMKKHIYSIQNIHKSTIVAIWRENMLGYLSADIICSEKRTVFRRSEARAKL